MNYFIFILALWSCPSFAGFVTVSSSFVTSGPPIIVDNMPRVRSQESLPICSAYSASCVAQRYICKVKNLNCASLDRKDEISPLSMLAWMHTNRGEGVAEARNHRNIQFYTKISNAATALKNASGSFLFMGDSCYPLDQLANDLSSSSEDKLSGALSTIQKEYDRYRATTTEKTEGNICEDCLVGAVQELNIASNIEDLKKAMLPKNKEDTFGEFLYRLTLGKCRDVVGIKVKPSPKFDMFPESMESISPPRGSGMNPGDLRKFRLEKVVNKLKDVLKTKNPLTVGGICLQYEGPKCVVTHSVAVSGYRKMCKKVNGIDQCRDVVKVQNSWGEDWQKNHDDGWVDAGELFSNQLRDPEALRNMLAWYS